MNEERAFTPVLEEHYEQCLDQWRRKRSAVRYLVVLGIVALAVGSFGTPEALPGTSTDLPPQP